MKSSTRQFLNILFEEDEKDKKEKTKSSGDTKYSVATSNKLSLGRPLSNSALADVRFRSEGSAEDAKGLLKDLKIRKPSGGDWSSNLASLISSAVNGELRALISGATKIQNDKGKPGILIRLRDVWKEDDKNGKLSYSFIRSLIVAANKAGWVSMTNTVVKNLRLELVEGKDELIAYVSRKPKTWG